MEHVVPTIWFIFASLLIFVTLTDGFSFINLSRKTEHRFGTARLVETIYWKIIKKIYLHSNSIRIKELVVTIYAPFVILSLIVIWLIALIVGFALLSWSFGEQLNGVQGQPTFGDYFYLSGVTFFTLGYGDLSPAGWFGHIYSLIEVGCGYSFIAIIIGFIPTITASYYDREIGLMKIQMQTGMSYTASGVLYNTIPKKDMATAHQFFRDAADWILKIYISQLCYPVLCYHRSTARRSNWLSGFTILLDLCAISMAWFHLDDSRPAKNMQIVGIEELKQFCRMFGLEPDLTIKQDRITHEEAEQLWADLTNMGFPMQDDGNPIARLESYLNEYSAYLKALSDYLLMPVPRVTLREIDKADKGIRTF